MTKSGKHCGKWRNCSFLTLCFQKAICCRGVYMRERVNSSKSAHPLAVLSEMLQLDEKTFINIRSLIEMLFTVSPSAAVSERSYQNTI